MRWISLVLILLVVNACSNNNNQEASQVLHYDSAIVYVHKDIADPETAATVNGTPVSWEQVSSQDVALEELQQKYQEMAIAFAYAWALSVKDSDGEGTTVKVYTQEPSRELKAILASAQVESDAGVTVEFVGKNESQTLAEVSGQTVSWQNFLSSNIQHAQQYEKVFKQRMQRLNGIVVRRLVLQASKEADLPMEEFVKSKILKDNFSASEQQARDFAKEKGISETSLDEKLVKRLQDIINQNHRDKKIEEYVAKNLVKGKVEVDFTAPRIQVKAPELNKEIPQWGKAEGPELLFVGHWSCDGCSDSLKTFLQTRDQWNNQVKGAFVYSFPEMDREARMGAEAGLCVEQIDHDAFWTFLQKMTELDEASAEEKINMAAKGSGVDFTQFRDCFLKRERQQTVDSHLALAKSMGVTSAPLVLLQGTVLQVPVSGPQISQKLKEMGLSVHSGLWQKIKSLFGF